MNQHEDIGRTEAFSSKVIGVVWDVRHGKPLGDQGGYKGGGAAWQTPWGSRGVQGGSTEGGAK